MTRLVIAALTIALLQSPVAGEPPSHACGNEAGLSYFRGAFSVHVAQPPSAAFGLFDATGERRWDPTWAPAFAHGDARTNGSVFATTHHGAAATWLVDAYDSRTRTVSYVVIEPGRTLSRIGIAVVPSGAASLAKVSYERTALDTAGKADVGRLCATFPQRRTEWQAALDGATR